MLGYANFSITFKGSLVVYEQNTQPLHCWKKGRKKLIITRVCNEKIFRKSMKSIKTFWTKMRNRNTQESNNGHKTAEKVTKVRLKQIWYKIKFCNGHYEEVLF